MAIARPRPPDTPPDTPGVGIDVVEITQHPDEHLTYALSESELALLDLLRPGRRGPRLWFARFWAAKEAAAKARGHRAGRRDRAGSRWSPPPRNG